MRVPWSARHVLVLIPPLGDASWQVRSRRPIHRDAARSGELAAMLGVPGSSVIPCSGGAGCYCCGSGGEDPIAVVIEASSQNEAKSRPSFIVRTVLFPRGPQHRAKQCSCSLITPLPAVCLFFRSPSTRGWKITQRHLSGTKSKLSKSRQAYGGCRISPDSGSAR
jgi:hypothetical protein